MRINIHNALRIAKPLVGIALLGLVALWAIREGDALSRLGLPVVVYSVLVASVTIGLNAITLKIIANCFQGTLSYRNALHFSALGALGNAIGGLPIGTALKYLLLYKHSGLRATQVTTGLVIVSIAISLWLLLSTAVSAVALPMPGYYRFGPAILLVAGGILVFNLAKWASRQPSLTPLINPFIKPNPLAQVIATSLAVTVTFLLNYWIVAHLLFPAIDSTEIVFLASLGILIGLGSLVQSVGGIQEVSTGLAAVISGNNLITGVELALVMRIASVIASTILLTLAALLAIRSRQS